MELEEVYREVAVALRRLNQDAGRADERLAQLHAVVEQLIEVLIAKQVLAPGHRRVLDKAAEQARAAVKPRVRLQQVVDKYRVAGADIDCAARLHLCHARCCSLSFELTQQDLDEGRVLWEISDPYMIRHERDGQCAHLDRGTLGCTIHAQRPATCRCYDCRGDPRIWIDFEAGIPAP